VSGPKWGTVMIFKKCFRRIFGLGRKQLLMFF
jgi:hypothetical protein